MDFCNNKEKEIYFKCGQCSLGDAVRYIKSDSKIE